MDNIIKVVTGDWSSDGHEITEIELFEVNLSKEDIEIGYKKGVDMCGVDIINLCADYQESTIYVDTLIKLYQYGIVDKNTYMNIMKDRSSNGVYLNGKIFSQIWLNIVKLGTKIFQYKKLKPDTFNIGGYGLYE